MDKTKVLIVGGNGMLGRNLNKMMTDEGFEVVSMDMPEIDITSNESVAQALEQTNPEFVVNCAAYTNVEMAEEQIELNHKVNAEGVGVLASETAKKNVKLVHISTDYVFSDNNPEGHVESDDPGQNQTNQYAKAKREGEILALKNNPNTYVVRTSWLYGHNAKNFIETMLMLSETKTELSIVDDEYGVPTSTMDVSRSVIHIIKNHNSLEPGYYHAVSEGFCTRYEQAEFIFKTAGKEMKLNRIKLADYPRKAKIQNYSILKNTKLPKLQSWESSIEEYIKGR